MKIKIEVHVKDEKPEDATHYLPNSIVNYECWLKKGHSMKIGVQKFWVADIAVNKDIRDGVAHKIV